MTALAKPVVTRASAGKLTPGDARAERIALALMGVGDLPETDLAETASWERGAGRPVALGRTAIKQAQGSTGPAAAIAIEQVVSQGAAGSVSGRIRRAGERERLFCHVIRYTNASMREIAQIVSFEHDGGRATAQATAPESPRA